MDGRCQPMESDEPRKATNFTTAWAARTTDGGRYWSNQKVELPLAWRSPSHAGGAFTYPPQFFGHQSGALAIGNRGWRSTPLTMAVRHGACRAMRRVHETPSPTQEMVVIWVSNGYFYGERSCFGFNRKSGRSYVL